MRRRNRTAAVKAPAKKAPMARKDTDMPTSKQMQAKRTSAKVPDQKVAAKASADRKATQTKAKAVAKPATPPKAPAKPKPPMPSVDKVKSDMLKPPSSIAEAKNQKRSTFTDASGKKKAAVTAEELKASGMSLRDYLNMKQGKTRK